MTPADPQPWRGRFLLYAAGVAMVLFGLRGIVDNVNGWTNPPYWVAIFVGGALVHDLVLAPVVFGAAVLLMRLVPERLRPPVAAGLVVSGVLALLALLALPGIRAAGRTSGNPSILPLDYGRGLLVSLAVVWMGVVAWTVVTELRRAQR